MPFGSLAFALIVTTAGAIYKSPFEGEVIFIVGGGLLPTETVIMEDVVCAPKLSVAVAVKLCDPKVEV